jgi:hypothetical protein
MFLRGYFESRDPNGAAGLVPLSLIAVLELYLTDFLKCTFRGENAQNRAFCGGEKSTAVSIYQARIN